MQGELQQTAHTSLCGNSDKSCDRSSPPFVVDTRSRPIVYKTKERDTKYVNSAGDATGATRVLGRHNQQTVLRMGVGGAVRLGADRTPPLCLLPWTRETNYLLHQHEKLAPTRGLIWRILYVSVLFAALLFLRLFFSFLPTGKLEQEGNTRLGARGSIQNRLTNPPFTSLQKRQDSRRTRHGHLLYSLD